MQGLYSVQYGANLHTNHIMLNKSERFRVLKSWRIFSILGPLPIHVDLESWRLHATSVIKQFICSVSYGFSLLHLLYKTGSLVHAYFFVPDLQLHQLIIHATVVVGAAMCAFIYYMAYIKDPGQFAAYASITLRGKSGGPTDVKNQQQMQLTSRLREYSMQDLVAMSLPYMTTLTVPVIILSYTYDPSMRLLLYAALPTNLQNWATFGLILVEETRFIMTMGTIIMAPIWQLQVISFDLVSKQLQMLTQMIQNGTQSTRNVYMVLRRLQLYVSMLNNVNCNMIYAWKLVSISASIICGYAAIAHFGDYPIFGVMYYGLLADCTIIYTVVYGKAFKIPQLFDKAASCALLHTRRNRTNGFRKQILSIRRTGIRVGHFHQMERTSTLIFVNYVLTNIVSMLVALR